MIKQNVNNLINRSILSRSMLETFKNQINMMIKQIHD